MPTRLQTWKNRRAFAKAKSRAEKAGEIVCGAIRKDGTPVYFTAPSDAAEHQLRELAFSAVEGRPMTDGERMLAAMAQNHAGVARD